MEEYSVYRAENLQSEKVAARISTQLPFLYSELLK